MSRGITPRFTTWCPEPTTPLGRDNPDGAPLEYHIRLLEAYRETLDRPRPEAAARLRRRGRGQRGLLRQLLHGQSPLDPRISVDDARELWLHAATTRS